MTPELAAILDRVPDVCNGRCSVLPCTEPTVYHWAEYLCLCAEHEALAPPLGEPPPGWARA